MSVKSTKQKPKKTPELRFSGFSAEWEEKKLSDLFIKKHERNSDCKVPLF